MGRSSAAAQVLEADTLYTEDLKRRGQRYETVRVVNLFREA